MPDLSLMTWGESHMTACNRRNLERANKKFAAASGRNLGCFMPLLLRLFSTRAREMIRQSGWVALAAAVTMGAAPPASAREIVRYDGEVRPARSSSRRAS